MAQELDETFSKLGGVWNDQHTIRVTNEVYEFHKKQGAGPRIKDMTIKLSPFDLNIWLNKENELLDRSHLIYSPTKGGKTIFVTHLLTQILKNNQESENPKKIAIIILSDVPGAATKLRIIEANLNRLKANNSTHVILPKNEDNSQIFAYDSFKNIKILYYMLRKLKLTNKNPSKKQKTLIDEDEITSELFKEANPEVLKDMEELLMKWTHFIFYFDDCMDAYRTSDKQSKHFWTQMATKARHSNITTIMNVQDITNFPSDVKTNLAWLYIIGPCGQRGILRNNFSQMMPSDFTNSQKWERFINSIKDIFKDPSRTILVFSKFGANKNTVFYTNVPLNFVKAIDKLEKDYLK